MEIKVNNEGKPAFICSQCRDGETQISKLEAVMYWSSRRGGWKSWILHRSCREGWMRENLGWGLTRASIITLADFLSRAFQNQVVVKKEG